MTIRNRVPGPAVFPAASANLSGAEGFAEAPAAFTLDLPSVANSSTDALENAPRLGRRGFLAALATFTGIAAAGVIEAPAARAASPGLADEAGGDAPAASSARLAQLNRQLVELIAERDRAALERAGAQERFYRLCPPRPRELISSDPPRWGHEGYVSLEFNISTALHNRGPGASKCVVFDRAKLAQDVCRHNPRSPRGRWLRKRLALADQFERDAEDALRRCGYMAAEIACDAVEREIQAAAQHIFAVEPKTLADVFAHARAIQALADCGHSGMWVFHGEPAPRLIEAMMRLAPGA